jgi:hypothetical protein
MLCFDCSMKYLSILIKNISPILTLYFDCSMKYLSILIKRFIYFKKNISSILRNVLFHTRMQYKHLYDTLKHKCYII